DVALGRVQRSRQLDVVGADLARELQPLLDRTVRILVANLARRQLLQRCGEDADLHELGLELLDWHGLAPCGFSGRIASHANVPGAGALLASLTDENCNRIPCPRRARGWVRGWPGPWGQTFSVRLLLFP